MKNAANKPKRNGRGRPSKSEQVQIERKLRPIFLEGRSAYYASHATGCSINTVQKYYNKFFKEVSNSEGPEFDQACKERMISASLFIENQIHKLEQIQKELEEQPKIGGTQGIQQYKLRIGLCSLISDLKLKLLNIANSPTTTELLAAMSKVENQK